MAKYFKFIGEEKIVMSFNIREEILRDKGWTKLVEPEPIEPQKDVLAEQPKPKRKYTKRKTNS